MQRGSFCVFPAQLGDGRLVSNNTCVFLLDTSTHSGLRHNAERAGSPATTERARALGILAGPDRGDAGDWSAEACA